MRSEADKPKILVLHGPNLNMLGRREPAMYGTATLEEIDAEIAARAEALGMTVETFQSNSEGALVERIHAAMATCAAVIINPAAFTHTSIAIRDALSMLDVPIVEVHLSNIYKREPFRHISYVADIAMARVAGLGKRGYLMALEAVSALLEKGEVS